MNKHNCMSCNWRFENKVTNDGIREQYCCMKQLDIDNPEEENDCHLFSPMN